MKHSVVRRCTADGTDIVVFGTYHSVDAEALLDIMMEYQSFDYVGYESGVAGFNPLCNEHKAVLNYCSRENTERFDADIDGIERTTKQTDLSIEDYIRAARWEKGRTDLEGITVDDVVERNQKIARLHPPEYMYYLRIRDMKMADNIMEKTLSGHQTAMVVGLAHLPGIVRRIRRLA